jgi:site-specific DNA-cytosine methylase
MPYTLAEFFCGCGGTSRGFTRSGRFNVVLGNDVKPEAIRTFAYNHREDDVLPHPMRPKEYVQGVVTGAVVLFPYPDEAAYQEHKFYKSIAQVEIGGLPFLPQTTGLMAEKLALLLASEYAEGAAHDAKRGSR